VGGLSLLVISGVLLVARGAHTHRLAVVPDSVAA
jgi:hypothetical protein